MTDLSLIYLYPELTKEEVFARYKAAHKARMEANRWADYWSAVWEIREAQE